MIKINKAYYIRCSFAQIHRFAMNRLLERTHSFAAAQIPKLVYVSSWWTTIPSHSLVSMIWCSVVAGMGDGVASSRRANSPCRKSTSTMFCGGSSHGGLNSISSPSGSCSSTNCPWKLPISRSWGLEALIGSVIFSSTSATSSSTSWPSSWPSSAPQNSSSDLFLALVLVVGCAGDWAIMLGKMTLSFRPWPSFSSRCLRLTIFNQAL